MIIFLIVSTSIAVCFFTSLIFALVAAGRRADEAEERLFELILVPTSGSTKLEASQESLVSVSASRS